MRNRKLLGGVLAGVAAIALGAGSVTYSAWSDTGTIEGNHAEAGVLKLQLGDQQGDNPTGDLSFDHIHLAPGAKFHTKDIWLATNSGDSTPSATLSVTMKNLEGHDATDGSAGQLLDEAHVQYYGYIPFEEGVCSGYGSGETSVAPQTGGSLASRDGFTFNLTRDPGASVTVPYLAPGQGMCFAMEISLPYSSGNETQGDSADFDLQFDLEQAEPGTSGTPYSGTDAPTVDWWNA